ncbi:hypothetical protein SAMN04488137_1203 [Fictibacillus solisalsi]|uniref:Uncharacterized protein n=1 Tax=Fictibacillus solisalsi TaxID=459525 RepID=A0A1G9UWX2_9BACL|nr:hypothetical protein [Fictibacillus solisalsi]SDM64287.1 hypothetical protein SAMN04488137_1203 [Fictibacillus solisalsi]
MPRRKLLVPGIELMLDHYREEIGEEFGIYRPVSERDAIMKESEKSKTDDKDKKEKSRRK